jgi:hypothetical protein
MKEGFVFFFRFLLHPTRSFPITLSHKMKLEFYIHIQKLVHRVYTDRG